MTEDFDIITADSKEELKTLLKEKISHGWKPCGFNVLKMKTEPYYSMNREHDSTIPKPKTMLIYQVAIWKEPLTIYLSEED